MILTILLLRAAIAAPTPKDILPAISQDYIHSVIFTLPTFGTRHSLSDPDDPKRGVGAARKWIKSQLESFNDGGGKLEVSFEEFQAPPSKRVPRPIAFANVVAVLPGTLTPERRYYIVGHYDSMPTDVMDPKADAPGANDDGSGIAAVLATAKAMAAHPCESTIVFLCTEGEEQGLIGAKYHADTAAAVHEHICAVLNNDIVGDSSGPGGDPARAAPHTIRLFSEALPRNPPATEYAEIRNLASESDSPSREIARFIAEIAKQENTAVKPMLVFRTDRFLRGGDHMSFNEAGFPAVRFCETYENYKHQHQTPRIEKDEQGNEVQYGDLPQFVDIEYLTNVTKLNAAALIHLANAPSPPAHTRIITAKLETSTTLRWDKSPEPDVAGYEVVWRDTTAPQWEHVKDVGVATEITMEESKDNFFFGVRAYDKDGYRSPVAFAGAAKD